MVGVGVRNIELTSIPGINDNFYKVYNNNAKVITRINSNMNINNNVNSKPLNLNLDAQNKIPYNARAIEELLKTRNPNAKVTSTTLPKPNQPNVRLAGKHTERTNGAFILNEEFNYYDPDFSNGNTINSIYFHCIENIQHIIESSKSWQDEDWYNSYKLEDGLIPFGNNGGGDENGRL